jgi:DNA-binding beta-propeller fold protein YncE
MIRGARAAAPAFITRSPSAGPARGTLRRIVLARAIAPLLVLAAAALAGCGSVTDVGDFPPAAGPATSPPLTERPAGSVVPLARRPDRPVAGLRAEVDQGRAVAVLRPRERVLEVHDRRTGEPIGRADAGVGPTRVAAGRGGLIYVVDTSGDGLLVYELRPRLHLTRRLPVLGGPYGIASDTVNQRLWVTTTRTNRLVELADGARPHRLRGFPAVRQPDTVAVDPVRHRVYVTGRADGVVQILDAPDTGRQRP